MGNALQLLTFCGIVFLRQDDGASLDPVQHSLQEIKTNFSVYDREK